MASPFKVFRKNAKVLLVGLFLLSMISFVVIPSFLQWLETRRGHTVRSVVSTKKFGDLSEMDLHNLWIEHNTVRRFLEALGRRIDESRGSSFRIRYFLAVMGEATEEQLVQTWLFSQYAEIAGVKVTDEVINEFIRGLINASGVSISPADLAQLLSQNQIQEDTLFRGLRREILVLRYLQLAGFDMFSLQPGFAGETPAMRWEYFLRFNRLAAIELCGIPVERYYERAPTPNDQQVREYFESHKEKLPDPSSPEPGFKIPAKVTVEYLKGDLQKWLVNVKLSDEELRNYYEQHKDEFVARPASSPTTTSESVNTPPSNSSQPSGVTPPAGETPTTPKDDNARADDSTANAKQESNPLPSESQSAEKTSEQPSTDEKKTNGPSTNEGTGNPRAMGPFRLASFVAESANSETEKGDSSGDTPAEPRSEGMGDSQESASQEEVVNQMPLPPEGGSQSQEPSMGQAEQDKQGQSQPSATAEPEKAPQEARTETAAPPPGTSVPTEGPVMTTPTAPEVSSGAVSQSKEPEGTASKYQPFEEVKERVRAMIISERIKQALDELEEVMRDYQTDWANYLSELEDAKKQKRPAPKEPVRPDLEKLAKEKNIDFVAVKDADVWTVAKLDIGKSYDLQGTPFVRSVFNLGEFITVRTSDTEQNQYLCWLIAKTDERVPELDEPGVRENVIRTWRMAEARKIAESEIAAIVEKVNKEQKSLSEFRAAHPDLSLPEVIQSEPFSWLTFEQLDLARFSNPQPRLGSIKMRTKDPASGLIVDKDAVEGLSNDFMAAVFSLGVGETGKAWNRPQSIIYLVRVIEYQPPIEQLREMFFRQSDPVYLVAGQMDLNEIAMRWIRGLEDDAGLKWNRPARRGTRD